MTDEQARFIVALMRDDDVAIDADTLKAAVAAFDQHIASADKIAERIKYDAYAEACRALKAMGHEQAADALWSEVERNAKRR